MLGVEFQKTVEIALYYYSVMLANVKTSVLFRLGRVYVQIFGTGCGN